jgi:hypothetical protein
MLDLKKLYKFLIVLSNKNKLESHCWHSLCTTFWLSFGANERSFNSICIEIK